MLFTVLAILTSSSHLPCHGQSKYFTLQYCSKIYSIVSEVNNPILVLYFLVSTELRGFFCFALVLNLRAQLLE